MKKLILLGLAVIVMTACKQEQRYFSSSAEIDALKSAISALENQDWDAFKSFYTSDGEIYVNSKDSITVDQRIMDLQEITSALSKYGFDEKDQFVEMIIDDDNETWVNFWGQWSCTFKYNGKQLSIPVHITAQFIDGKASEEHIYYDGTSLSAEFNAMAAAAKMNEESMEADSEE
ncbi:MAG: nuclear transport factor 2 family protein [Bacteroidetes bacterium]|nr:MAG: nuclear transport factor 2 family protein [Bacteroidota bacterium]